MASVLMSEVATGPVAAYFFFVEGSAIFCPQLLVWAEEWISQFVISMCKLTFTAVAAMVVLNPVLAELSLEPLDRGLSLGCTILGLVLLIDVNRDERDDLRHARHELSSFNARCAESEWIRVDLAAKWVCVRFAELL